MKIQSLSNQNFTGNVVVVKGKSIYRRKVHNYFPPETRGELKKVKQIVLHEPCDLFVIKSENFPGAYEFVAAEKLKDVTNYPRVMVDPSILKESFVDAAKDAISNFKNLLGKKQKGI